MDVTIKQMSEAVDAIKVTLEAIKLAKGAPEAARKELSGALIGHKNWDGYGLREIRGKDLHERTLAAVTERLVADLAARKTIELKALAVTLDQQRTELVEIARQCSFGLVDDAREARTWAYPSTTNAGEP